MTSEISNMTESNGSAESDVAPKKGYFEFRLRIRYWWLAVMFVLALVGYPFLVIYTAFSMQYNETHGPEAKYQKQWEETGCPEKLRKLATADPLEDWDVKHRWKHLLRLDDSYLARNNQAILNEPLCLGATIAHLVHDPGRWRYDIVDTKTQTIIVSITKGN